MSLLLYFYALCFILFYILCCEGKHCSHSDKIYQYPANGTWIRERPYWKPQDCDPHAFNATSATDCLKGRTVYVVGISTARQIAFSILTLLGGETVSRQQQKTRCPTNDQSWGPTCQIEVQHVVDIKFLFLHYMDGFWSPKRGDFPYIKRPPGLLNQTFADPNEACRNYSDNTFWPYDSCVAKDSTESCVANFLNESTPNDVLIFNIGQSYASPSRIVDVHAWLRASAKVWRHTVSSSFPGKVFHIVPPELHNDWVYRNEINKELNDIMWQEWGVGHEETKHWVTVDQLAINEGRERLYNDRIHYAGLLTDASVQMMLNHLCPNLGSKVDYFPELPLQRELANRIFYVRNSSASYYFIDGSLMVHPFTLPYTSNISCYHIKSLWNVSHNNPLSHFKFGGEIDARVIDMLEIGQELPDKLCQQDSLVREAGSRSVYAMIDGELVLITSAQDMIRRKYSFDDVVSIYAWQMTFLELKSGHKK